MGKITVFTTDECPFCKKAKDLLSDKKAPYDEISLSQHPEWRGHMFILAKGINLDTKSKRSTLL